MDHVTRSCLVALAAVRKADTDTWSSSPALNVNMYDLALRQAKSRSGGSHSDLYQTSGTSAVVDDCYWEKQCDETLSMRSSVHSTAETSLCDVTGEYSLPVSPEAPPDMSTSHGRDQRARLADEIAGTVSAQEPSARGYHNDLAYASDDAISLSTIERDVDHHGYNNNTLHSNDVVRATSCANDVFHDQPNVRSPKRHDGRASVSYSPLTQEGATGPEVQAATTCNGGFNRVCGTPGDNSGQLSADVRGVKCTVFNVKEANIHNISKSRLNKLNGVLSLLLVVCCISGLCFLIFYMMSCQDMHP